MTSPLPFRKILFRIVSISFVVGAGMELFMIYGRFGGETFYDTVKRLELERRPERQRRAEEIRRMIEQSQREEEDNRKEAL